MADLQAIKGRWSAAFSGDACVGHLPIEQLRTLLDDAIDDLDALVREVERLRGPACDGDHAPPACASVTCWRSPSPDYIAGMRAVADAVMGGSGTCQPNMHVDPGVLCWLLDIVERARSQRSTEDAAVEATCSTCCRPIASDSARRHNGQCACAACAGHCFGVGTVGCDRALHALTRKEPAP